VQVEMQATEAPPPLPEYEQPQCPEPGYMWTPGYWGYSSGGYYWIPGTWVSPPQVGVLWTPGYWGFVGGVFAFNAGYWGPHIGFYGGVNYGFGYVGVGYAGGRWNGGTFAYNTAVNNVNVTVIHNTYNERVVNNVTVNRVSYNGGSGGIAAAPTAQERAATQERHVAPTPAQQQHVQAAAKNPALFAKANGGHPAIAATARPGAFTGPGVVGARGAAPKPAVNNDVMHANGQRPNTPPAAPGAKPASPPPAAAKPGQPAAKPAPASTAKPPAAPKAAPPKPAPPKPAPKPPKEDKPQGR
jgi:WXXGXW repeat (2 copies)